MKVEILNESGYDFALLGTSLSRDKKAEDMILVCENLASKNGGHNKFLEFISVWLDITAPRYFWQQMATYRIGNSWLSESTMYTILKKELNQSNFEDPIDNNLLDYLNNCIRYKNFETIKNSLPEGFLQRRIMVSNYKALKNIYDQRKNHKLFQWKYFCNELEKQIQHPEFIVCDNKVTQ
jgi:hypothetical protein